MLEIRNLHKEYHGIIAVDDISFTVYPGEIFGLLGPNGAGKSTTIKIILRILRQTSGEVVFNGNQVTEEIQSKTGYLPEERGLYKKSKVIDVLRYFGELKGMTKHDAIEEARRWLKRLEIEKLCCRKIEELSKGNQQKVQFITSLMHDPEILILDEPFSGFDPINQQIIKELLKELCIRGKIILISTHLMDTAEELCRNILIMNKGEEVLKGTVEKIKSYYTSNIYEIGFSGSVSQLCDIDFIEVGDQYNGRAQIRLKTNIDAGELLDLLIKRVRINHFIALKPSLFEIYLEAIRKLKPESKLANR